MIARHWAARTTAERAPEYAAHLRRHVLPDIQAVEGYAGAMLLEREAEDGVELLVITMWNSLAAIEGFAGADIEHAVVADEAAALLTGFDDRVQHYEVTVRDRL